jgi:hypothetical protein
MGTFADTARLITVYRLPTKENKLPFSVFLCNKQMEVFLFSVCNKQTEVAVFRLFRFPLVHVYNYVVYTEMAMKMNINIKKDMDIGHL